MGTWKRAKQTIADAEQYQRECEQRRKAEREAAEAAERIARDAAGRRKR